MDRKRIKRLRLAKGLTLKQAAKGAGMSGKQHWWNIEDGRQGSDSISVGLLDRMAAVLGVPTSDLMPPAKPARSRRTKGDA